MSFYNCFGKEITGIPQFSDPSFGVYDNHGKPLVNWNHPSITNADEYGFDIRNMEENGEYIDKEYVLPKGTMLCRYGLEGGMFTTYRGSSFESLGLPWKVETIPYYEYEVTADAIHVRLIVVKGKVAPAFYGGGGVQFLHYHTIRQEVEIYHSLRRLEYGTMDFTGIR